MKIETMEEEDEPVDSYHFMVCSVKEDGDIAREIHDFLEDGGYNLHGYLPDRDAEFGKYCLENFTNTVEKTEKIIVLLSKNSLGEGEFLFNTEYSMYNAIEKNKRKVIPILVDINRTDPDFPKCVQHLSPIEYSNSCYKKRLLKCFGKDMKSIDKTVAVENSAISKQNVLQAHKEDTSGQCDDVKSRNGNRALYGKVCKGLSSIFWRSHKGE